MTQERLWTLTPRELDVALRGAAARREEARHLAMTAGWIAAACTRAKRLPKLERLLRQTRDRSPRRQSVEEQIKTIEWITALWTAGGNGAPVRGRQ